MLLGVACVAGCGGRTLPAADGAGTAVNVSDTAAAGIALPAGPGRELLLRDCTGCHDLGGLALFQDFYTRDDWHALVETMVGHGAATAPDEVEVVTDYLAQHFSPTR